GRIQLVMLIINRVIAVIIGSSRAAGVVLQPISAALRYRANTYDATVLTLPDSVTLQIVVMPDDGAIVRVDEVQMIGGRVRAVQNHQLDLIYQGRARTAVRLDHVVRHYHQRRIRFARESSSITAISPCNVYGGSCSALRVRFHMTSLTKRSPAIF